MPDRFKSDLELLPEKELFKTPRKRNKNVLSESCDDFEGPAIQQDKMSYELKQRNAF